MAKPYKTFLLSLRVKYRPNGESADMLRRRMTLVLSDAVNNGTLTGDGPATVESWKSTVTEIPLPNTRRKAGEHRWVEAGGLPVCASCGCDEDDAFVGGQTCTFGKR